MNSKRDIIRFGIMVDSLQLKNWQIKAIERLIAEDENEFVVIFLPKETKSYSAKGLPIGYRFIERQLRKLSLLQTDSIEDQFDEVPKEKLAIEKKGHSNYLTTESIEAVAQHQLDFILRFGFGILRGEVLDIPRYGIWSFHHGNPELYRGGPPAFWEFLHEHPTNGLILQKLTNELDAGVILRQATVKRISHSYAAHHDRLFALGIDFPRWVANAIRNNHPQLWEQKVTQKGPIYKVPSNWKVLAFYVKLFKAKLAFHYRQLFRFEIWNIGVAPVNDLSKVNWAPQQGSSTYQADPFMAKDGTVYFELYDYASGKGEIACRSFKNDVWGDVETVLKSDLHYSYPFVLEVDNQRYLVPEQYQANEVALYSQEGEGCNPQKQLLKGEWVDATLFEHDGLFWLFASPKQHSNEELHLFYAHALDGDYQSHPLNPVKIDIASSRPGGKLYTDDQGRLIRPSQNSTYTYGGAITLNHITALTTKTYAEERVGAVYPQMDSTYPKALHTYGTVGDYAVIDGKTYRFVWSAFKRELKRKFNRLF